jgi:hypothetical protein
MGKWGVKYSITRNPEKGMKEQGDLEEGFVSMVFQLG